MTRFDLIQQQLAGAWPVLAIAAVVIFLIGRRGLLSRRLLKSGPDRTIGLAPADLLIGFGLMIIGAAVAPLAMGRVVTLDPGSGLPTDASLPTRLAIVLLGQLFIQLPPVAYLVVRAARTGGLARIGLLPRRPMRDLGLGVTAVIAGVPLVLAVMVLTTTLAILIGRPAPVLSHDLLPAFQESGRPLAKAALIVAVTVLAPILEEGLYRGLLQSTLVEVLGHRRRWWAVGIAATVFMMIHLPAVTWHALPALLLLGVLLGWLYERTGSLWPSILLHAGFNACNVLMVIFLAPRP